MIQIPVLGIVGATIEAVQKGQQVMSCFHYQYVGEATILDGKPVLDAMSGILLADDGLVDYWTRCCSDDVTGVRLHLQVIYPVRYAKLTYFPAVPAGQVNSPAISPNLAVAITKVNERAGRHYIGTLHMPGVPTSFVTDQEVNGAGTVAYGNLRSLMDDPIAPGGVDNIFTPVIFNRSTPANSAEVDDTKINFPLRVMRRRTVGLGS